MQMPMYSQSEQYKLYEFAKESNQIEGIDSDAAHNVHADALTEFLKLPKVRVSSLEEFVKKVQPNAFLRTEPNHMVIIGGETAPSPTVSLSLLDQLLKLVNTHYGIHPWDAHAQYEVIHPFMDGNGRSGRALWLWHMCKQYNWDIRYPFLQTYYYQTLDKYRHFDGFKI